MEEGIVISNSNAHINYVHACGSSEQCMTRQSGALTGEFGVALASGD